MFLLGPHGATLQSPPLRCSSRWLLRYPPLPPGRPGAFLLFVGPSIERFSIVGFVKCMALPLLARSVHSTYPTPPIRASSNAYCYGATTTHRPDQYASCRLTKLVGYEHHHRVFLQLSEKPGTTGRGYRCVFGPQVASGRVFWYEERRVGDRALRWGARLFL